MKYQRLDVVATHLMKHSNTNNSVEINGIPNTSPRKLRTNLSSASLGANAARAPPLDVTIGDEVTVINADRSNLTWKRFRLMSIDRNGSCTVQSLVDSRERTVPRSLIKPKGWINKFKELFAAMAIEGSSREQREQYGVGVELRSFQISMQLLGAEYDHDGALRIFKALDIKANGRLSFKHFMNWVYGLGRTVDKGLLLTTIECMTAIRQWDNALQLNVMEMGDDCMTGGPKPCQWTTAQYMGTDGDYVNLETEIGEKYQVSKDMKAFRAALQSKLKALGDLPSIYSPSSDDQEQCCIVVMGPSMIGKTALISKFVRGVFPHDHDPTIQDSSRQQIRVDDDSALVDILDTAGQDEFASMRYDWLKDNIDVLFICFSLQDHDSFVAATELLHVAKRLLRQHNPPKTAPVILVALQSDLSETQLAAVSPDEYEEIQSQYGGPSFVKYHQCSALMDDNVQELFADAVRMARRWRRGTDKNGSIAVRMPTAEERRELERRRSHTQQLNTGSGGGRRGCLSCTNTFCPAMAAYMGNVDGSAAKRRKLSIASVPKDKFGDELAAPSYSKQHFFVHRELSYKRLIFGLCLAVLFPFFVILQTFFYVCYCSSSNCCFKWLPENVDWTDHQQTFLYDILGPVIGRDPRDKDKTEDSRKWFLSQTCSQKVARILFTGLVAGVFFGAWYNAIINGSKWFFDDESMTADEDLAVVETLGPLEVWFGLCLILAVYMALDIDVTPQPPSMQALRPYVMYLNKEESIRTTAYVFLRGFAKSTLNIFRLEATTERIVTSLVASIVYILIPGVVRVTARTEGDGKFFPPDYITNSLLAMLVNFVVVFALMLGLQMQLLSGLLKYIEWMEDITSMLDQVFSEQKKLHYIGLTRHNNMLAWLEMRSYLYTKGLIIFSRQEIFVVYLIVLEICCSLWILYKLITTSGTGNFLADTFGSPSFWAFLYFFFLISYGLMRILINTRRIESLQTKQIALLAAQKFQIYYKRITWHPPEDDDHHDNDDDTFSGGDDDSDLLEQMRAIDDEEVYEEDGVDIAGTPHDDDDEDESDELGDVDALPPADDPVEEESDSNSRDDIKEDEEAEDQMLVTGGSTAAQKEQDALLNKGNGSSGRLMPIDSQSTAQEMKLKDRFQEDGRTRLQSVHKRAQTQFLYNDMAESGQQLFSADYLEQSEKLVLAAMNICEAQDIIPRVFNIQINSAVGLSILCTVFAVFPTVIRLAFTEDECSVDE